MSADEIDTGNPDDMYALGARRAWDGGFSAGFERGAAVAFGIIGMAEAIRARWCCARHGWSNPNGWTPPIARQPKR